MCVHCLCYSQWGLTLSPLQHDFVWPNMMILFTKLSSLCHRVFYHLRYHAMCTDILLYVCLVGILYTLSLVTHCSIARKNLLAAGFELGASGSTVRGFTLCAISWQASTLTRLTHHGRWYLLVWLHNSEVGDKYCNSFCQNFELQGEFQIWDFLWCGNLQLSKNNNFGKIWKKLINNIFSVQNKILSKFSHPFVK